ncbi:hypothetical protein HPB49_012229 [Dermacentor silvarum]|uniref:Uncharacterized protein n=1 Tax=Dermacentor silvarum TaxID=543639 RepID=A0ACB8C984_DERSI|nr:hypothetical protein HPB49_012229 [Dermacentor silvarum]
MSDPDNNVERLPEAIKQHSCVYDTKRLDFRDQQRKANAWEEIRQSSGLATGLPGEEDSASTPEAIFNTLQDGTTTPPPTDSNDISLEAPAANPWEPACQGDRTVGEPPSKRPKKVAKLRLYFEQQLLSQLGKQMTENEAFAQSIAMSLDRMARGVASRCKARIMALIA